MKTTEVYLLVRALRAEKRAEKERRLYKTLAWVLLATLAWLLALGHGWIQ